MFFLNFRNIIPPLLLHQQFQLSFCIFIPFVEIIVIVKLADCLLKRHPTLQILFHNLSVLFCQISHSLFQKRSGSCSIFKRNRCVHLIVPNHFKAGTQNFFYRLLHFRHFCHFIKIIRRFCDWQITACRRECDILFIACEPL